MRLSTNNYNQEKYIGWWLIIPALIILTLVFIYPITRAFWMSFFQQNLGTELESIFAGFSNYSRLLGDGRFWQSLRNTTIFTAVSLTLELILGMVFALILNQAFFCKRNCAYNCFDSLGFTYCDYGFSVGMDF